jgi:hypothetical protein
MRRDRRRLFSGSRDQRAPLALLRGGAEFAARRAAARRQLGREGDGGVRGCLRRRASAARAAICGRMRRASAIAAMGQVHTASEELTERAMRIALKRLAESLAGRQPANHHLDAGWVTSLLGAAISQGGRQRRADADRSGNCLIR